MRLTKTLILAAMTMLCSTSMKAQCCGGSSCEAQQLGYKPYPYWFVQAQGGINSVFTDVALGKHLAPTASIGFGRMFTPIIGARLHVNGWKTTGAFTSMTGPKTNATNPDMSVLAGRDIQSTSNGWEVIGDPIKYSYNYITTDIDVMVNIFNIFSKKVHRPVDLYFVGGLGLSYAWNNNDFEDVTGRWPVANDISNAWGSNQTPRHSLLSHNLRAGLLLDYNFAKNWAVGAEVDFNSLDDRFNSKYNNADDWMLTAQLSLTYKFGFKKCDKPVEPAPVVAPEPEPAPVVEPTPEPVPEPVKVVKEPIKETIFYEIRANDPNPDATIKRVVDWANKYPEGKISVSGYADKGTGNPKLNIGYSQKRANAVTKTLISKGIAADRITTHAYGDTVQPFAENDRNRCVIIVGDF